MASLATRLALYERAVQHPQAEVAFFLKAWAHYHDRRSRAAARLLREDFCGTAAVARAWVGMDPEHQALAVDHHAPTLEWAHRRAIAELGDRAGDLHFLRADVRRLSPPAIPRVDVIAALNFSAFVFHSFGNLRGYLHAARAGLRAGGLFILDAYGGPGAMRIGVQKRHVPGHAHAIPGGPRAWQPDTGDCEYQWDQRAYDAVTARVDCRIHFQPKAGAKPPIRSAFRYDWRLWTLPELLDALRDAGFREAEVWCDRFNPATRQSDGIYRPTKHMPAREDWVAYAIGVR